VRSFFRFVVMSLVLIAVGVMSALTAMRIAIHGREVTVPEFVKLSPAEAERIANRSGLAVTVDGQFYSADVPEGRIVSQQPPPGSRVRRGWQVRLAQSLGLQRAIIPDVQGQSPRAAELNIRQRGLELDTVAQARIPDSPLEEVIAQSPPPAAVGVLSPKISVLVAATPDPPMFVMPNFVGQSLVAASAQIEEAGFKLSHEKTVESVPAQMPVSSTSSRGGSSKASSIVLKQFPAAGQRITLDTPIILQAGP
jgi:eukaryotic-like serine/threonine-protein kinase